MSNFGSRVSALVETTRSSYRLHVYRFKYTHVYIYIYIFYVVYSKFLFQFFYYALFFINIYEKSIIVRLLGKKRGEKRSRLLLLSARSSCFSQQIRLYYILKKIEYHTRARSIRYCSCYNKLSLTTLEIYSSLLLGHKTVSLRDSGPGVSSMHYTTPHFKWTKINFSSPHVP